MSENAILQDRLKPHHKTTTGCQMINSNAHLNLIFFKPETRTRVPLLKRNHHIVHINITFTAEPKK